MIQIDGISSMGLSIDNILSMDRSRVSDVKLFSAFAEGIKIDDEFLFNERWTQSGAAPQTNPIDFVMFEMLPSAYDLDILEKMGGSLGFRISGVGDYTLISLNNRVVTLSGLPIDFETNNEVLNCEISPDVFMGFCRGLLLDVADDMLEKDDEFESRVVSDGELIFNEMPSGGYAVETAGTDFGESMTSVRAHNIGTVNNSGEATGSISSAYDQDWIAVTLDSQSTYNVSLQGNTLLDPYLRGIYNAEGVMVHEGNDDGDDGLNSQLNFRPSESGVYYISAGAYASSTGSYTMSVTAESVTAELDAGVSHSAGGAVASAMGVSLTGASASACWQAAYATGVSLTGVSVSACGRAASRTGVSLTGASVSACGMAGSAAVVSGCNANASACGMAGSAGLVVWCSANASACASDMTFAPCAAYAVACIADFGFGADVGVCVVNVFPILPSC